MELVSAVEEMIEGVPSETEGSVKPELLQSVLEIATDVCRNAAEAAGQLEDLRRRVRETAEGKGLTIVGPKRECKIVDAGVAKELDLEIVVPVEDMAEPGAAAYPSADGTPPEGEPLVHVRSIWPAIYPELLKLVRNTPRRSSSSTTAAQPSAWRSASTSCTPTNLRKSCRPPSTPGIRLCRGVAR